MHIFRSMSVFDVYGALLTPEVSNDTRRTPLRFCVSVLSASFFFEGASFTREQQVDFRDHSSSHMVDTGTGIDDRVLAVLPIRAYKK